MSTVAVRFLNLLSVESSLSRDVKHLFFSSVHPACISWAQQQCKGKVQLQMLPVEPDYPVLLLTTISCCCLISGTGGLASPSLNQLLLDPFQCFCFRVVAQGAHPANAVGGHLPSFKPFSNLRGSSFTHWCKISSFLPFNSLPKPSHTPGSPPRARPLDYICTAGELSLPFPMSFLVQI